MLLAERVAVSRRFQRAIRIDTDLGDPLALEGFVCPPSSAMVLETMAQHLSESGQGAFTWTGPYGSGKSSLVVALSALLGKDAGARREAASAIGERTAAAVSKAMPPKKEGWRVLPIVGRRDHPERLVEEGVRTRKLGGQGSPRGWSEKQALDALWRIASRYPDRTGGLIVFIDEMGKMLEGAARDGSDVYFFQQLAEMASRSDGRLVVVGILHQAFEEYSYRLFARNAGGVVQDTGPLYRPAGERRRRGADRPFGTGHRKRPPTGDTRGAVSNSGGIDQPPHRRRPA